MQGIAGQEFVDTVRSRMPAEAPSAEHGAERAQVAVQALDPLQIPEWDSIVATHPDGTCFHGRGWASVLHETYGHRPKFFCRFRGGRLESMLPVMEVNSRWTGRRGVSLPFTDVCEPLAENQGRAEGLYEAALEQGRERGWRYLECRANTGQWRGATPSVAFHGHLIDLRRPEGEIFDSFEPSVRRSVRKAQAAQLRVEFSPSLDSIRAFYALHCLSRKRHGHAASGSSNAAHKKHGLSQGSG